MVLSTYKEIEEFWTSHKRVAFFGLSRTKGFAGGAYRMLLEHGHELIPIHPEAPEIEGVQTLSSLEGVTPIPSAAAIVTGEKTALSALESCAEYGIRTIFVQQGAWPDEARQFCEARQITVVTGCVYICHGGFPHSLHRWAVRMFFA